MDPLLILWHLINHKLLVRTKHKKSYFSIKIYCSRPVLTIHFYKNTGNKKITPFKTRIQSKNLYTLPDVGFAACRLSRPSPSPPPTLPGIYISVPTISQQVKHDIQKQSTQWKQLQILRHWKLLTKWMVCSLYMFP